MYNTSYDGCALVVVAVIFLAVLLKKNTHEKQNVMFLILICFCCVSISCDMLNAHCLNNMDSIPLWVVKLSTYAFFIAQNILPIIYVLYILTVLDIFILFRKIWFSIMVFLPLAFMILVVALNPTQGWLFTFSDDLKYSNHYMVNVLYGVAAYHLLIAMALVINRKDNIPATKRYSFYAFLPIVCCFVIYQILNPYELIINFGLTICILIILITIENREDVWDGNTNMLNRSAFMSALDLSFSNRRQFMVSFIQIANLEYLKSVYGAATINDMIKFNSVSLSKISRKKEEKYCVTEGQFALISRTMSYEELKTRAEGIIGYFKNGIEYNENLIKLDINICLIRCPQDARSLDEVFDYLNASKGISSENSIVEASEINKNIGKRKLAVEQAINRAIENDLITIVYQPIYSCTEKRYVSIEALTRIKDEKLGKIMPSEFIPIIEQNGQIVKIGLDIFEKVCKFIKEEKLYNKGLKCVQVNLSAVQCKQDNLAKQLLNIIEKYEIPPSFICFEVTESAVLNSKRVFLKNMKKLQSQGVQFALDDYGTGYSNMNSIISYPFNLIKIDKSLVDNVGKKTDSTIALDGIVSLISKLAKEVIVEGVESENQAKSLENLSCNFMQGFYFSKPVSGSKLIKKIDNTIIGAGKLTGLDSERTVDLTSRTIDLDFEKVTRTVSTSIYNNNLDSNNEITQKFDLSEMTDSDQ